MGKRKKDDSTLHPQLKAFCADLCSFKKDISVESCGTASIQFQAHLTSKKHQQNHVIHWDGWLALRQAVSQGEVASGGVSPSLMDDLGTPGFGGWDENVDHSDHSPPPPRAAAVTAAVEIERGQMAAAASRMQRRTEEIIRGLEEVTQRTIASLDGAPPLTASPAGDLDLNSNSSLEVIMDHDILFGW